MKDAWLAAAIYLTGALGNVHEVAQAVNPSAHFMYVDNDPVVLTHAQALLTSSREEVARFFDGLGMVAPGLVPMAERGTASPATTTTGGLLGYCGIGRKPLNDDADLATGCG